MSAMYHEGRDVFFLATAGWARNVLPADDPARGQ